MCDRPYQIKEALLLKAKKMRPEIRAQIYVYLIFLPNKEIVKCLTLLSRRIFKRGKLQNIVQSWYSY